MKKILVIQTAFIGDCVLSLPFLKKLKDFYPSHELHVVSTALGAELFKVANLESGLDLKIHVFDKRGQHRGFRKLLAFSRELKGPEGFELAFCLQRSFRSALLAYFVGAQKRIGFSSGAASYLYTHNVKREWDSGKHEIEKNLDLLRDLGFDCPSWVGQASSPALLKNAFKHCVPNDAPIAFSLSSPWPTKEWNLNEAIQLAKELTHRGEKIVLLGDSKSQEPYATLKKVVPSLLIEDFSGKTSVREWIDKIASSKLLVSGDSAAVHVAADLGVPVVAVFGPTIPEFGFAPWRRNSYALGLSGLACRPCHIHGPRKCPLLHHNCMKELKSNEVFLRISRLIPVSETA